MSRIQNAKFKDIATTLGRFDDNWRKHFEGYADREVKDAIDSIVNNRNQIAHGGQANISLMAFSQYYKSLKFFISELDTFIASQ